MSKQEASRTRTGSGRDLSHIMMFEVEEVLGPYRSPKVVLYNKNKISQKDALYAVRAGEYNDNVLCLDKRQFVALFRDGKDE